MSLTYSLSEIMLRRWLKTTLFPIDFSSIVVVSFQDLLSSDGYYFSLSHTHTIHFAFHHRHSIMIEKVSSRFFFFFSPHTHILETYIESCLSYTCARASKLHKQSRNREKEEMRQISLVLSPSTIMMIASSSHTHTHGIVSPSLFD
jgi:hypothetical protein